MSLAHKKLALPERYLQLREAADYCGHTPESIRKLIRCGRLTPFKPLGRIVVKLSELDSLIQKSRLRRKA